MILVGCSAQVESCIRAELSIYLVCSCGASISATIPAASYLLCAALVSRAIFSRLASIAMAAISSTLCCQPSQGSGRGPARG